MALTTDGTEPRVEEAERPERAAGGRGRHGRPSPWRRWRAGRRSAKAARRERRAARRTWMGRHPWASGWLVVLLALTPVWVSLGSALTNPGAGAVGARFVEWVRDHGGSGIVRWAEDVWYSHHAPPKGGKPPRGAIPPPTQLHAVASGVPHLAVPAPIVPFTNPPIAGEGQWHAAGRPVDGVPAVYEAYMRPDPVHTSLVIGVAWMDTELLRATLYSGSYVPGGGPWTDTAPIPKSAANSLVAVFNSGFRMQDAQGGYYAEGKTVYPLRDGDASFVVYSDGTATVGQWGRDAKMGPQVASVRQNLHLLVDGGKPVPGLLANDNAQWGFTLGGAVYVWRSGVGVTADGALVYVGGPGLNITTLADCLVRAGAVRAMELDINSEWVNMATFDPGASGLLGTSSTTTTLAGDAGLAAPWNGTLLLPQMDGGTSRYFGPWNRDFITLSARPSASSPAANRNRSSRGG
ncbi:MAG: phosphodiester glycosidase family protein [Acidimicrobiales bacterium]